MKMIIQPQGGCVICFREIHKTGATALRLKDPITLFPRVAARRGNPGLQVLAPLGQKKPQRHQSSHAISVATGSYTQSLLHFPKDITVSDFNLPLASGRYPAPGFVTDQSRLTLIVNTTVISLPCR